MLEQENLGENILYSKIDQIIDDKGLGFELSERVKRFYNPEAARLIAGEIAKIAS